MIRLANLPRSLVRGAKSLHQTRSFSFPPFPCRSSYQRAGAKLDEEEKALSGYTSTAHFFHIRMEAFKTHAHEREKNKDEKCTNRVATNETRDIQISLRRRLSHGTEKSIAGSRERRKSQKHAQLSAYNRTYTHINTYRHTQTLISI